ncbi:class I adenylate-forming enzyme family protein [Streptomyces sp. L7]
MRELLRRHERLAETRPDDPAVSYRNEPYVGTTLTWADLCVRAEKLRQVLLENGVRRHRVCALVLHDHPDLLPALLALWQLDSPPVLLDPKWGSRLTEAVLAHSTPSFLIEPGPEPRIRRIGPDSDEQAPVDAMFIGYTSGSTGDPKAIAFTHERLYQGTLGNASASERLRGCRPRRIARSMRMSGSGVINLHHTWGAVLGACVVVLPELTVRNARDYWARIAAHDIDQTFLVPQLIEVVVPIRRGPGHIRCRSALFHRQRTAVRTDPGSLPATVRPPSVQRLRALRDLVGRLLRPAGTGRTCNQQHRGSLSGPKHGCGTRPDEVVEGAGEGEIELRGAQVFGGYHRNESATRETLVEGWLRTGDIARRDTDGFYHLVGRSKDVVMKGSYAIYLNEVEEVASAHPDVLEAAGVPLRLADSSGGHRCPGPASGGQRNECREPAGLAPGALGVQRAPCRVVLITEPLPRGGRDKLERPQIVARWDALPNVPRSWRSSWRAPNAPDATGEV